MDDEFAPYHDFWLRFAAAWGCDKDPAFTDWVAGKESEFAEYPDCFLNDDPASYLADYLMPHDIRQRSASSDIYKVWSRLTLAIGDSRAIASPTFDYDAAVARLRTEIEAIRRELDEREAGEQ